MTRFVLIAFNALAVVVATEGVAVSDMVLTTPVGIEPGQQFVEIFVTSASADTTQTSISYYNNFVNTAAAGITYNGGKGAWQVVGETSANDNFTNFLSLTLPVYNLNSGEVSANASTMLATELLKPILTNELGTQDTIGHGVATGENGGSHYYLGDPSGLIYGEIGSTTEWSIFAYAQTAPDPIYGYAVFTAVPEPSSMILLGLAIGGVTFVARLRRPQKPVESEI